jgi:hypothetical protein
MLPDFLKNRDPSAPIQGSFLNLTAGVWIAGVVSLLLLQWDALVEGLIGIRGAQDPTLRTVMVVTVVAAVTLVTIADMTARAVATSKGGEKSERDRKIVELVEKERAIEEELHKLLAEDAAVNEDGAVHEPAPAGAAAKPYAG